MGKYKGKVFKVGNTKLPGAFATEILIRFMEDKEIKEFHDRYLNAQLHIRGASEPTAL